MLLECSTEHSYNDVDIVLGEFGGRANTTKHQELRSLEDTLG